MSAPPRVPLDRRNPEETAFDALAHGSRVDWTQNTVLIDGRPVILVSAEFHYFRVPDRDRWRPLLVSLRGAGFNCLRLYIHWGYHCPAEGVYNFRGNRDIDYLLTLCKELQLFVIAAPGPYICAEVQAGGYPIWLIAKRNLRIRHMRRPPIGFKKEWDEEFHKYCEEYMHTIMPFLVKYERTNSRDGPIIALQIENELRQQLPLGIGGLEEEIRKLGVIARKCGSTVPFFHNDDSPIGSWSNSGPQRTMIGTKKRGAELPAYRLDFYGFDLYFTFPPGDKSGDRSSMQVGMIELCGVSACINICGIGGIGIGGSDTPYISCLYHQGLKHAPPPTLGWAAAGQMPRAIDHLEKKFARIGGSCHTSPVVCAEAQVGWINQWGRFRSYDDIYNFFGPDFSATLQVSLLAQGINIINHYMAYGGTNHGSVGDTEVYSSYDYSAFIREFGMLSERGRNLRHINFFARTFGPAGLATSLVPKNHNRSLSKSRAFARVKSTLPGTLITIREAVYVCNSVLSAGMQLPLYAFLRNLKKGINKSSGRFNLIVDDVVVPVYLPPNQAMIVPLYHSLPQQGWSIFACTVPVICREIYAGAELWVLRTREAEKGRLIVRLDPRFEMTERSVAAKWAVVPDSSSLNSTDDCINGLIRASDKDEGAATSFLNAPLEELPLSEWDAFANSRAKIAVCASTEAVGLCFSFAFRGSNTTVVEITAGGITSPLIRLLCLTERDADTFSVDLSQEEPYMSTPTPSSPAPSFACAWGVSELAFTPSQHLEVGYRQCPSEHSIFLLSEKNSSRGVDQFQPVSSKAVLDIFPNMLVHDIPEDSVQVALRNGIDYGNPLDRTFQLPLHGWTKRKLDWADDVTWKPIAYANRDPLDHHMTSSHILYRIRFKVGSRSAKLVINVRHAAVVWCNGKTIGRQICFSHNAMSAGAMHAVDLYQSGKKTYDLTSALQQAEPGASGCDEVIILVFSCGQGRCPFMLNDVRNKRGILSAKLRGQITEMTWAIAGVEVSQRDDAFASSGIPFEDEANDVSYDVGFRPVKNVDIVADDGVQYFRGTFNVPANSVFGGNVRYPLRLKVFSAPGVVAMIWINGLLACRYVADMGPQSDFYIPEGLIAECKNNSVVLAAYGDSDSTLTLRLLPWVIERASGNLDETSGSVYALRTATFSLVDKKLAPGTEISAVVS